jgi:hypothetical protein
MISQKKVRLMAVSAIYRKHGGDRTLYAAEVSKVRYCVTEAVRTGFITAAALVCIKILQCLVNGQWDAAAEAVRVTGFRAFFGLFHPAFDICFIGAYMLFAFWWYGKSYESVSEEAKKEKNRRELIARLDQPRRTG